MLEPFGDEVPEDLQLTILSLWNNYPFGPTVTNERVIQLMIDLLLSYGTGRVALEIALILEGGGNPEAMVSMALNELAYHGFTSQREIEIASSFVSYLLDDIDIRQATLVALRDWPEHPSVHVVLESIVPQLDHEETAFIKR